MSEEENKSVENEGSQAVAPATESTEHNDRQDKAKEAEIRKRNELEFNWAETRRKMQELERRTQEQQEELSRLKGHHKPAQEEDELSRLAEDDILTVAQAKKLAAKMAESVAKKVVQEREASMVDERLSLKFEDFSDVVSKENIELLKQTEPELAMSLYHIPDPYTQGVTAYKLLKKLQKPDDSGALEKKKALENSQKPVSVQAVAKHSAIGNAHLFENGLTPELKKQMWAEMQQAMKAG